MARHVTQHTEHLHEHREAEAASHTAGHPGELRQLGFVVGQGRRNARRGRALLGLQAHVGLHGGGVGHRSQQHVLQSCGLDLGADEGLEVGPRSDEKIIILLYVLHILDVLGLAREPPHACSASAS